MSSAKRAAGRPLNSDNWDEEDEAEDAGVFKQADESEMKNRVVKRAKRRGVTAVDDEAAANKPALFTGFSGFGIPTAKNPSFSFNKKNDDENSAPKPSSGFAGFGAKPTSLSPSKVAESTKATEATKEEENKSKYLGALKELNTSMLKWLNTCMEKNPYCYFTPVFSDYAKHLANLKTRYNQTDLADSDKSSTDPSKQSPVKAPTTSPAPSASFSPAQFGFGAAQKTTPTTEANQPNKSMASSIFGVGKQSTQPFSFSNKKPSEGSESDDKIKTSETSAKEGAADAPKPAALFSFGASKPPTTTSSAAAPAFSGFSFAAKPSADADKPVAPTHNLFGCGSKPNTGSIFGQGGAVTTTTSLFGAGAKPFSFSADVAAAKANADSGSAAAAGGDDDEYVPPKPEVENKITEDDALYTKRVKLFYEKEGKYVDKGIGNLFIKPLESGKNSLLIRADTNLGNILLNIQLAESLPVKRMGKNNVSLVCVPNPPMEAKAKDSTVPTMLLIRVKTGDEADEVCEKLNEYKK